MNNLFYLSYQGICKYCKYNKFYCENLINGSVKRMECPHFTLIFVKIIEMNSFKLKITFSCNSCCLAKTKEFDIGKMSSQNKLITEQSYDFICCLKTFHVSSFLSRELMGQDSTNDLENNENSNISTNNDNNITKEIEKFNSRNIIEFNKKCRLVTFIDDKNKKEYKIYTKPNIKLKFILEDLGNRFPELDLKDKKFFSKEKELNLDFTINECGYYIIIK